MYVCVSGRIKHSKQATPRSRRCHLPSNFLLLSLILLLPLAHVILCVHEKMAKRVPSLVTAMALWRFIRVSVTVSHTKSLVSVITLFCSLSSCHFCFSLPANLVLSSSLFTLHTKHISSKCLLSQGQGDVFCYFLLPHFPLLLLLSLLLTLLPFCLLLSPMGLECSFTPSLFDCT